MSGGYPNNHGLIAAVLKEDYCWFTNSWLSDEVDLEDEDSLGLVDIAAEVNAEVGKKLLGILAVLIFIVLLFTRFCRNGKMKIQ